MIKSLIKKFAPKFLISWYHFLLAFLGAVLYGFPSRKMVVIGVTGTKGKTTVCNLIAQILNQAGLKTSMAATVNFRIGEKEWLNSTKQTMLGRLRLQKLLAQMVKAGCKYAVIETSSEGILQHRHRFIDYNAAVLTNLSPEHIERHGSFENYRAAKTKLFEKVSCKNDGIGIYNLDDENVEYFLKFPIKNRFGFSLRNNNKGGTFKKIVQVSNIKLFSNKTSFEADGVNFEMNLLGEFNVYNAVAAIAASLSLGLNMEKIKEAVAQAKPAPGRLELVQEGQNFTAIVDYSYEPTSLENALKTVRIFNPKRVIVVFGSAAGGRDKWRRPIMGELAAKYADLIIVTTDDPYEEEPEKIIDEILAGVLKSGKRKLEEDVFKVVDRLEAIKKSLTLAKEGDVVLFAGKGGELWMNVKNGHKIPWDEANIVREEIRKLKL